MTNETLETIKSRRSCRAYKPEQITNEELDAVLEAGTYAASAMGRQSAKIVVVQDAAARAQLTRMNAAVMGKDTDPMYGAPTILVVLADAHAANAVPDGSLVMGNLMLAAASLGLGSCWINRAKEEFESRRGQGPAPAVGHRGRLGRHRPLHSGLPCCRPQARSTPQAGLYRKSVRRTMKPDYKLVAKAKYIHATADLASELWHEVYKRYYPAKQLDTLVEELQSADAIEEDIDNDVNYFPRGSGRQDHRLLCVEDGEHRPASDAPVPQARIPRQGTGPGHRALLRASWPGARARAVCGAPCMPRPCRCSSSSRRCATAI